MRFLEASNYCLGYSDSDDGSYDPSRECFNLEVEGAPHNTQGGAGPSRQGNATPPPNPTPGTDPGARGTTYKLANEAGEVFKNAWNIEQLRRFYP